jgi:uncharacterized protein (DUF3084 family)
MQEQLENRLQELRTEFEKGQQQLANLEAQANALRNTLLRISGAIQVLEEELGKCNADNGKSTLQPDLKMEEVADLRAEKSEE